MDREIYFSLMKRALTTHLAASSRSVKGTWEVKKKTHLNSPSIHSFIRDADFSVITSSCYIVKAVDGDKRFFNSLKKEKK